MILFFNTFVTNSRYSQGGLNRIDRLDLFKYTLASYSCINSIDEVILFCGLDDGYSNRFQELIDFVTQIFVGKRIHIYNQSPNTQPGWQDMLRAFLQLIEGNQPILYSGNDDHVFIDYDLDVLNEGLLLFSAEPVNQINTIHISSWPEAISTVYGLGEYTRNGRYWVADMLYPDAIQIVNPLFFKHVCFDLDWGGKVMRRTDWFLQNWFPYLGDYAFPSKIPHPMVKTFIPLRELVRHFDAYTHIEMPLSYCPRLEIPPGFFQDNIQINYCGGNASEVYSINPLSDFCDKKMFEDLPLFWRPRISKVLDFSSHYPRNALINARNQAYRRVMVASHMRDWQNPKLRFPAKPTDKYRRFPNGTELPLDEETLKIVDRCI